MARLESKPIRTYDSWLKGAIRINSKAAHIIFPNDFCRMEGRAILQHKVNTITPLAGPSNFLFLLQTDRMLEALSPPTE
ncbi:MAG: hypothetical protein HOB58_09530 [Nitrospina sp.]|nr:hypothetical protein [Nitrospina sp.]